MRIQGQPSFIPSDDPLELTEVPSEQAAPVAPEAQAVRGGVAVAPGGGPAVGSRMDLHAAMAESTAGVQAATLNATGRSAAADSTPPKDHTQLRAAFDRIDSPSAPAETYRMDKNTDAFASRWKTLEGATKTFDTTYFIWNKDIFGMAYLGQMLKKQRAGVQVRGMVDATADALGTQGFKGTFRGQDYLQELVNEGGEFGVFNPFFSKDFSSLKSIVASNHDKLAIADGDTVETGGRNMAAHYFSDPKDHDGVYRDTDIHVESAVIGRSATKAFETEFNAEITKKIKPDALGNLSRKDIQLIGSAEMMDYWLKAPPLSENQKSSIRNGGTKGYVNDVVQHALSQLSANGIDRKPSSGDMKVLREMAEQLVSNPELRGTYHNERKVMAGEVKMVDSVSASSDGNSQIHGAVIDMINSAQESIFIHNPYVVLTDEGLQALAEAGKRGVEVIFGTNSPESTDSAATQAFFLEDWPTILARVPNSRIIVATGHQKHHAKSFVVDGVLSGVSTYNADWISARVNSEVITLEWGEEFAQDTIVSYQDTINDPAHDAVEYKILRDEQGKAVLVDGKPVIEFGPEDHMDPEALHDKYDTLQKVASFARNHLDGLSPLKHAPLDASTDNVREMDLTGGGADVVELAESRAGRRALEKKIDKLESGWTDDDEAAQIMQLRGAVTSQATADERAASIDKLMDGVTLDREEVQVKDILTSASPGDKSKILDQVSAERLVSELEDADLGAVMASLAKASGTGRNGYHLLSLLRETDDDGTFEMMKRVSDRDLKMLARSANGHAALRTAVKNLDEGWTTGTEDEMIARLRAARK